MKTRQFSIWLVDLEPAQGSEQGGIRPCILLQTNAVSDYGFTTLMAPVTTKKVEKIYPYEVKLEPSVTNGLKKTSKIKFDQVRVIDKNRLKKPIGQLEKRHYDSVFEALKIIFDWRSDFR